VHEEPQLALLNVRISSHDLSLADGSDRSEKGEVRGVKGSEGGDFGRVGDAGNVEVGESPIVNEYSNKRRRLEGKLRMQCGRNVGKQGRTYFRSHFASGTIKNPP
jgi:hypothetical protein